MPKDTVAELKKETIPPLAQVCDLLQQEVQSMTRKYRASRRRTDKGATLMLLATKYHEVLLILDRLIWEKERHKQLIADFQKRATKGRTGPITDPQEIKIINEQIGLSSFLHLDVKTLYLWCYEILDVFRKANIDIDLAELTRVSWVRNVFLTHIAASELFKHSQYTQGGFMYDTEHEKMEILFHPLLIKKDTFRGLPALVRGARACVPELRNETNHYEQINILYRNYNALPRRLREKVDPLIKRIGVKTEPPNKVAWVLLDVLRRYRRAQRV